MSSLTSPPLSSLLASLFPDAEASDGNLRKAIADSPAGEMAKRARSEDYRAFYMEAKDYYLAVSAETGRLIYMLARGMNARNIDVSATEAQLGFTEDWCKNNIGF